MKPQNFEIARVFEEAIVDLSTLSMYSRQYITSQTLGDPGRVIRLAVLSNYSSQYIELGLPLFLASRGISAQIGNFEYNSWRQQIIDVESDLYLFEPTHVLLLLTSIELTYGHFRSEKDVIESILQLVLHLGKKGIKTILTIPEPLEDEMTGSSPLTRKREFIRREIESSLLEIGTLLIDLDPLIRRLGSSQWYSNRFYTFAKLPFNPDFTHLFLGYICDEIAGSITKPLKLIIVDFDDTLWGGEVGELGVMNVDLDSAGPGLAYLRFQNLLKNFRNSGVILAGCSKNTEANAFEVFSSRPEMILSLEDFVTHRVNWQSKSKNVSEILNELNLSATSVLFLDNSVFERAEVRNSHPELIIPELPDDPTKWIEHLYSIGIREPLLLTSESKVRTEMYVAEKERKKLSSTFTSLEEFLESLEMNLTCYDSKKYINRVIELLNKTNQFNLTGESIDRLELELGTENLLVPCFRLKDKFGDSGIVSAIILKKIADDTWSIHNWVMSCRVFNRGVEIAVMSMTSKLLGQLGAKYLIGHVRELPKNQPVRNVLSDLGFLPPLETSWGDNKFIDVTSYSNTSKISQNMEI